MVLAELAGGVAHRLERGGDRHRLRRQADGRAGLADGGHPGADRQLAGDEVGAARRAARLGIVVGEQHAFGGDLVEVRRPARHHAAVVGADVPDADVVAHDDDDVRLLLRCSGGDEPHQGEQHHAQSYDILTQGSWFASHASSFPYHCSFFRSALSTARLPLRCTVAHGLCIRDTVSSLLACVRLLTSRAPVLSRRDGAIPLYFIRTNTTSKRCCRTAWK